MTIHPKITASSDELTAIFEDIHAHPELGLEETRTAAIVAEKLRAWGVDEVHESIGVTGVVGIVRGKGQGNRCIGLRADMDALPILEDSGLGYSSTNPGKMHACGHDGHTTALLGAAKYLTETRDFDGTVVLIFQPAEEGLGGARAMLEDGLLERFPCDELYGIHNRPGLAAGKMVIKKGTAMAGSEFFDITVKGVGSHAARPQASKDPIVIASSLVTQIQSIVSRNVDPIAPCVISVTQIHGGSAYNIVPQDVTLTGTIRYFDDAVRDLTVSRLKTLCAGIGAAYDIEIDVKTWNVFNTLENDPDFSDAFLAAGAEVFGAENVGELAEAATGSEDFADMLRVVPGAYCNLGHSGSGQLHHPAFKLGQDYITNGAALLSKIVEKRLELAD